MTGAAPDDAVGFCEPRAKDQHRQRVRGGPPRGPKESDSTEPLEQLEVGCARKARIREETRCHVIFSLGSQVVLINPLNPVYGELTDTIWCANVDKLVVEVVFKIS